jgi:hypothetical protein
MKRFDLKRDVAISVSLVLLGLMPASAQIPDKEEASVQVIEGNLSVRAQDMRQDDLLKLISEKTGIRFHAETPLDQKASVSFQGLGAEAALREILGSGANLFFRYGQAKAKRPSVFPEDVWVLGKDSSGSAELPAFSTAREIGPENPPAAPQTVDVKPMNGEEKAATLERLRSGSSEERVQAMARVFEDGKAGEDEVRAALETATNDGDPQVRMMAMQALANLPDGSRYVHEALHDPDAGVRLMALASLSPGTEDAHLVREALNDPDQAVRSQAEEMVKSLGLASTESP